MTRIFLFCFLLICGCDSSQTRTYPFQEKKDSTPNDPATKAYVIHKYSVRAEGIYGLLWPEKLSEADPELLKKVISHARDLQKTRKDYTIENERVLRESALFRCECVTAGLCNPGEDPSSFPPETSEKCSKLDHDKLSNDEKLSTLYSQQIELKEAVLNVGGDWLENEEIDLRIDFESMKFNLNALRFSNAEKKVLMLEEPDEKMTSSYDKSADRLFQARDFLFWSAGQPVKNGLLTWEMDGVEIPGTLQFQGELKLLLDGIERQGLLGFQLPSKL